MNGVLAGQTGWYDYSFADPSSGASIDAYRTGVHGRIRWTDKKYVRWAGLDDESLTRWMAARLGADLAAQKDAPAVVVVTHMLPFRELVPTLPPLFAFVAGFLGAALLGETILGAARAGVPIKRAIAGHLHDRREAIVDGIPAETSPIGYPREYRHSSLEERVRTRVKVIAW